MIPAHLCPLDELLLSIAVVGTVVGYFVMLVWRVYGERNETTKD